MNLILAIDGNYGIGLNGKMPWHNPEDLKHFREITEDCTLICGRKTLESLPLMRKRFILYLSRESFLYKGVNESNSLLCSSLSDALGVASGINKPVFVIGGKQIYEQCLRDYGSSIARIYLSHIPGVYECDTFLNKDLFVDWYMETETVYETFTQTVLVHRKYGERQYLSLLRELTEIPTSRDTRNAPTFSEFDRKMVFDLKEGFPLLTTKQTFFRGIFEELMFFLRGETDTNVLSEKKVHIWEGNTSEEFLKEQKLDYKPGLMGPMYGYQWRFFGAEYDSSTGKPTTPGFDQLAHVISLIQKDPNSRRLIMTSYNPAQAHLGVLYPCHGITIQFYCDDGELSLFVHNRSQDMFLGVPFNIASYALFLTLIAKLTGYQPGKLTVSMGDMHLYAKHITQAKEQIARTPFIFPKITVPNVDSLEEMVNIKFDQIKIENYKCHSKIGAEMIA